MLGEGMGSMALDPRLQVMLERNAAAAAAAPAERLVPEVLREAYRSGILAALGPDYRPVRLDEVRDTRIAGVPVRVYRPGNGDHRGNGDHPANGEPAATDTQPLPVVAFAHAGGWVIGDLETHDEVCRHLATTLPGIVVAVDYRRAPEHVYPAAIDDYWAVVQWLSEHAAELGGDPDRLVVAGDSAGGNMALVTALRARERGGPRIAAQAAAYPVTDLTFAYGTATGSYEKYGEGYGLTTATMHWFADTYVPDPAGRGAPDLSPLLAGDLSGLPPAVVMTAEYDLLSAEGDRYGARLREAGVPVSALRGEGLVHGFLYYPEVSPACATARDAFIDAIRSAMAPRACGGIQQ